jgi:hypothetical protein
MKERPILFSDPMVRAILEGRKTQTRRIVKYSAWHNYGDCDIDGKMVDAWGIDRSLCPYGQPGDRLWVRETWRVGARWDNSKPSDIPPNSCTVLYKAGGFTTNGDAGERIHGGECSNPAWAGKTRTAIHMPRWVSRIDLEVTGVRVERLQEISEADAEAEGVRNSLNIPSGRFANENFAHLWESINGPGSWDANPWVWVVEFRRIKWRGTGTNRMRPFRLSTRG